MRKIIILFLLISSLFSCTKNSTGKISQTDNKLDVNNTIQEVQEVKETPVKEMDNSISSAIKFLSMGFNASSVDFTATRSDFSDGYFSYNSFYFYGYEGYSEAIMSISDDYIELSTNKLDTFYPQQLLRYMLSPHSYTQYQGQNNSIGYSTWTGAAVEAGMEYKFEDNKLVYWARSSDYEPYSTLEKIEQHQDSIIIRVSDERGIFLNKYFNIPDDELLDLFLKKYVKLICEYNDIANEYDNLDEFQKFIDYSYYIMSLLGGRTARELAIFKNCLFAIKGCRFENSEWTAFFEKYLEGYKGYYTDEAVMTMFTENEKGLLDLVVQFENQR